jgi:hypothetical protein
MRCKHNKMHKKFLSENLTEPGTEGTILLKMFLMKQDWIYLAHNMVL